LTYVYSLCRSGGSDVVLTKDDTGEMNIKSLTFVRTKIKHNEN